MATALASSFVSRLQTALGKPYVAMPSDYTLSHLVSHGGLYLLHSPTKMLPRLLRHATESGNPELGTQVALALQDDAKLFFQFLSDKHYAIPSELVSWITFPHDGQTYTKGQVQTNQRIPSAFTFIGQFIDHDLTFNGFDLFDEQLVNQPPDFASPNIDLDSVYHRHYPSGFYKQNTQPAILSDVFEADGKFRLIPSGRNRYDLPRATDTQSPFRIDAAYIFDPRNDENQLLLQVHILIQRLHNRLVVHETGTQREKIEKTRAKVVEIWQSVILNDFLPRLCLPSVLADRRNTIKNAVASKDFSHMHYKPDKDGKLHMPHEFAIGFRVGHSMLRDEYQLTPQRSVKLFVNRDVKNEGDLRGGKPLSKTGNFLDWEFFYNQNHSLLIDTQITPAVFDLPESTIPDEDKTAGNLPFRNLTRSRTINICCGEDLAEVFGVPVGKRLKPEQVEPTGGAQKLFEDDRNVYPQPNGVGKPVTSEPYHGYRDQRFKTPLWYYLLREAELQGTAEINGAPGGTSLGTLGSMLISEVILGGIYYGNTFAYKDDPSKKVLENIQQKDVKLLDLIHFVTE